MGIRRSGYEEQASRNAAAERLAERDTRRDFGFTCLRMVGFVAIGYVFLAFSARTSDMGIGQVLFWTGLTIWIPGVMFTLLGYYRRGEKRGDW
jgi:hypothetical protein